MSATTVEYEYDAHPVVQKKCDVVPRLDEESVMALRLSVTGTFFFHVLKIKSVLSV